MKVAVIGAGSWGTALAHLLANCDHEVVMWSHRPEVADHINSEHRNPTYLKDISLPHNIRAKKDLKETVRDAEMVVSVVPSHVVREVMGSVGESIPLGVPIVSASKGIENETLMTMSEVLEDVLPIRCHPFLSYLSGPSFALEVANRIPTAFVIASYSDKLAKKVQKAFHAPAYMRVYTSIDVVGVEMGGALKNVIAIAAGCASGMGLGYNTTAGMVTRGLNEIARLAVKRGANPITLMGLSGMGDLVLTCTGPLSRNRTVGTMLGQGMSLEEVLGNMNEVAEGVKTARSVYNLAKQMNIEMPISEQVYHVLYEGKPVAQALNDLMDRDLKRETVF